MRVILARFGLTAVNIVVFFVEEGWIIAMVAIFPFWVAILAVTALLSFFSISSTYLCSISNISPFFKRWLDKQEQEKEGNRVVQWAVKIARGVALLSSLIVAIVVSPTTAALMLHQAGLEQKRAYMVDVVYSGISGAIWCVIYGLGINLLKIAYLFIRHLMMGGG